MTKGQCRKCAQRTGARHRGAGGVFSRMVPKPTEEKKSITVANNPNRRRSRWRDGYEGQPRKRPRPDPPPPPPQPPSPRSPPNDFGMPRPPGRRRYPRVVGNRNVDDNTPARVANTTLLRLHHDSDRKRELEARSPDAMSPLSLHGLATAAAYARPGRRVRTRRSANEERGDAEYDPDREDELADQLEEAMRRRFDGLPELDDGSPHKSSPDRFSPGSHHARMERYQRGQGHRRSMLNQIGSISGLDYGHQAHLQNTDLVFWENLNT